MVPASFSQIFRKYLKTYHKSDGILKTLKPLKMVLIQKQIEVFQNKKMSNLAYFFKECIVWHFKCLFTV